MLDEYRILLIDDSAPDRALAATLLREGLGRAHLREVGSAVDFAEQLGDGDWTVAIADRILAWADGMEVLRAVKHRHPRCRTILFTSQPPEALGALGMGAGVDGYLRKDSTGYLRLPELARDSGAIARAAAGDAERGSRARWHADLTAAPVGYLRMLPDGTILEANPALSALLGLDRPVTLEHRSWLELLPDEGERSRCAHWLRSGAPAPRLPVHVAAAGSDPIACTLALWPAADAPCIAGLVWEHEPSPRAAPRQVVEAPAPASATPPAPVALERSVVTPIRPSIDPRVPAANAPPPPSDDSLELDLDPQALEPVPLKDAVLAAMERLRPLITETDARIRAARLPTLEANRSEMVRLFRELIENALKARASGKPQISVRAEDHVDGWLVSVRDNGTGIPEARRKALSGSDGTDLGARPGSGLAICQRIAKRYGGDVWLTSEPGRGTTAFVALKARAAASGHVSLSVRFNGETMGEISVSNASSKREIARAALGLPMLRRNIGDQTIKSVQFVDQGVVNIVA